MTLASLFLVSFYNKRRKIATEKYETYKLAAGADTPP